MTSRENRLNDLSGAEWLYWTDTIYITKYPVDATHALRKAHGAIKPPEVMAEIIRFFTKEGQMVLDPMAGVGGTLLGAALTRRASLGFELNPAWVNIYQQIKERFVVREGRLSEGRGSENTENIWPIEGEMQLGDCLSLLRDMGEEAVDAVITDPPYGCQHEVSGFRAETNFHMFNETETKDLGNAPDFVSYLALMRRLGEEVFRVLRGGKYFVLMVGDRFRQGEYIPLGHMVAREMQSVGFKLKGIRIWSNKATQRPLKPYAVKISFVPNITHQNILILRKES